jgi:hypothetical protein
MNFLKLTSDAVARYKVRYSQYWLDQLVERILKDSRQVEQISIVGTVFAVLRDPFLEMELVIPGVNIVTNDGDIYYAQSAAAETPTDDFDGTNSGLRLGDDNTPSPAKTDTDVNNFLAGTGHALDATYEKTNDGDTDNTGAGTDIVTWRYSYTTAEGNASGIIEGAIVDNRTTPTAALTHFLFGASFAKTSSDTLKVFVNHTMNGV